MYGATVAVAETVAAVVPSGDSKLLRTFRARRGLLDRIRAQSNTVRDSARTLVWFHAPSVGEGLQARPVVHALREAHPDWQIAFTFFSPSAESFAKTLGADICDYLPFDSAANADALLEAMRPSALVFSKLDVWPMLVARARARGVPVLLISATLAESSARRSAGSRMLVGDAYASLSAVGAIDAVHAERLELLGVPPAAITVTGDTRFDQVIARASNVDRGSGVVLSVRSSRPTLVAGSTWPADESVLLAAWVCVRNSLLASGDRIIPRLLIAPHEPTMSHCEAIIAWADRSRLSLRRLTSVERDTDLSLARNADVDVILVDRVGVLGDLYACADVAFVGGGFHSAGLHSVIEPAAFGAPVVFGPGHGMSREAGLLLASGGARSVASEQELADTLTTWMLDARARSEAGECARSLVERERGATVRTVRLIESQIPSDA